MLKQYNGLYNIDYKIQVIQCNECHLERCLSGKCSSSYRHAGGVRKISKILLWKRGSSKFLMRGQSSLFHNVLQSIARVQMQYCYLYLKGAHLKQNCIRHLACIRDRARARELWRVNYVIVMPIACK